MIFKDRHHAGTLLAPLLTEFKGEKNAVVLGLARGGIVTAAAVAKELQLPLDVLCPRKLGAPFNPELAIGAISDQGEPFLNDNLIMQLGVSDKYIEDTIAKEKVTAQKRLQKYRQNRPRISLDGKTVILIDDGLATGATMHAAIKGVRATGAARVIVAVPVAPPDTVEEMRSEVDEILCLAAPSFFAAVGQFYDDFSQTEDDEVVAFLQNTNPTNQY